MAEIDVTRIAGNIGAMNSLNALSQINKQLSVHQTRLSTGKRINSAADDPAGLTIATKMLSRSEGLKIALSNIGDAKNLLAVAESGLGRINDILVQMRNKAEQGASDTLGSKERDALITQLKAYTAQIDDIATQTEWNGNKLIDGTYSSKSLTFQTGVGKDDYTTVSGLINMSATKGTTPMGLAAADDTATEISYSFDYDSDGDTDSLTLLKSTDGAYVEGTSSQAADFRHYMDFIGTKLDLVSSQLSNIGAMTGRLTFKEDQVAAAQINVEAAYNRIMNANMAEEQVNSSKFQILQQTATAMLAQANAAPQFLLSLFR